MNPMEPLLTTSAYELVLTQPSTVGATSIKAINAFIDDKLSRKGRNLPVPADFKRHFSGTYTSLNDLKGLMGYIMASWPALKASARAQVRAKIAERAPQCTPGFHDGLYEIVKGLKEPTSLADFLQIMRENLVNRASQQYAPRNADGSIDIHKHEQYYATAQAQGYGVRANLADVNIGNVADANIRAQIEKVFIEHYQPVPIIKEIMAQLKAKLSTEYDYHGLNTTTTGYIAN